MNPLQAKFKDSEIILGSKSPRRKELLSGLGLCFDAITSHASEEYPERLSPAEIPVYLAQKKAKAFSLKKNQLLITADTIVYCDGEVLEKPNNALEAKSMLRKLSNNSHIVYSGYCISSPSKSHSGYDQTEVTFGAIEDHELEYYIDQYEPYDKAGSYGIQEWIGYIAIQNMNGSFYTVMGLPVYKLYQALMAF